MRRVLLVERLRELQAEVYGLTPIAERIGHSIADEDERKFSADMLTGSMSRNNTVNAVALGAMRESSKNLARRIDSLIIDIDPPRRTGARR